MIAMKKLPFFRCHVLTQADNKLKPKDYNWMEIHDQLASNLIQPGEAALPANNPPSMLNSEPVT